MSTEPMPAPPQTNMDPADFQLLDQLDRDNVAGGARPVIESQGWEQARRLSDEGFIAIESIGLGGRLHITRKGMKAVAAFKRGEIAPSPQTNTTADWFSQVVNFLVTRDMLDARDEYDISDIMAALADNYEPAPQNHVKPLIRTQIQTLANNIHNVNDFDYTIDCLTHHLAEAGTPPQTNTKPDTRPANCRFRLHDEGKAYPRSACVACGATIISGIGNSCAMQPTIEPPPQTRAVGSDTEGT